MPKIMSLGNCTCEDWVGHAQDLSDRILNSSIDFPLGGLPVFNFCPYCGKKLVVAGAGHKNVGTWRGKPLQECDNQELIEIVQCLVESLKKLQDDLTEAVEDVRYS